MLYSGASSQLDVLTPSAGEESTLTETRRVFDEVQSFTKRKVDEYNSALEEVHKTLASATETGSSQVAALTVQLQDLTETVQEQSVGIQQRVSGKFKKASLGHPTQTRRCCKNMVSFFSRRVNFK